MPALPPFTPPAVDDFAAAGQQQQPRLSPSRTVPGVGPSSGRFATSTLDRGQQSSFAPLGGSGGIVVDPPPPPSSSSTTSLPGKDSRPMISTSLGNLLRGRLDRRRQSSTQSFTGTVASNASSISDAPYEQFHDWYIEFLQGVQGLTAAESKSPDDPLGYQTILGSNHDDVTAMVKHLQRVAEVSLVKAPDQPITTLPRSRGTDKSEPDVGSATAAAAAATTQPAAAAEQVSVRVSVDEDVPEHYVSGQALLTELLTTSSTTNALHSPSSFTSTMTSKLSSMMQRTTLSPEEKLVYTNFLATSRYHTPLHTLFDRLAHAFLNPEKLAATAFMANARMVKANAAKILMTWLSGAHYDFVLDPTLKAKFFDFLKQVKAGGGGSPTTIDNFAPRLAGAIESSHKAQLLNEWRITNATSFIDQLVQQPEQQPHADPPTALADVDRKFVILEDGHRHVADTLARIDRQLHSSLRQVLVASVHILVTTATASQSTSNVTLPDAADDTQPQFTLASLRERVLKPLRDWVVWTSLLCNWVLTSLAAGQRPAARVLVLKEFIKLANDLRELGDMYGCLTVTASLRSPWIACQDYMWRKLSKKNLLMFRDLQALLDSDEQYSAYKQALAGHHGAQPVIPFLPIHLLSIVRLLHELPVRNGEHVDPDLLQQIQEILLPLESCDAAANANAAASPIFLATPTLSAFGQSGASSHSATAAPDEAMRRLQQHILSIRPFDDADAFNMDAAVNPSTAAACPSVSAVLDRVSGEPSHRKSGMLHGLEGSVHNLHASVSNLLIRKSLMGASRSQTWSNNQLSSQTMRLRGSSTSSGGGGGAASLDDSPRLTSTGNILAGTGLSPSLSMARSSSSSRSTAAADGPGLTQTMLSFPLLAVCILTGLVVVMTAVKLACRYHLLSLGEPVPKPDQDDFEKGPAPSVGPGAPQYQQRQRETTTLTTSTETTLTPGIVAVAV
ncbi:hypothetical protein RI367_003504 [Sorochytrium milnesiophthora]